MTETDWQSKRLDVSLTKKGSAQEFDGPPYWGRFAENHELGSGHRHALALCQMARTDRVKMVPGRVLKAEEFAGC